jgi:hypothetical protein
MIVPVIMPMMVVMIMIVVMVVIMAMFVIMPVLFVVMIVMMVGTDGMSTAFRLERRLDGLNLRSEGLQRLLKRGVAAKANAIFLYLDRYVAVAEVPGQPCERLGIFDAHFEERLGFRDDLHNTTIVEHQCVVGTKTHRFGKIQFDAGPFDAEQKPALRLTLRVRKDQRVDDGAGFAVGGRNEFGGARHVGLPSRAQFSRAGRSGSSLSGAEVGASAGALSPSARPSVGPGATLRSHSP